MKPEDLDIYAKSYPRDALMIRCVVLSRLELDEKTILQAGEEIELEPGDIDSFRKELKELTCAPPPRSSR